jgi:hypothetical protein
LSQLSHPETSGKQPPEEPKQAEQGTRQGQGPGQGQEQATSKTMAFGEFSQSPAAQNPNTVAAAETCNDIHAFMMNVFRDQTKISEKEVRQRFAYKWKKCLIEVVPQSPLFRESLEMQARHRTMVEISKMRGGNPTQKEEREAKKKSFMDNFVGEKHKAAYGFCCWERALEDKRSKSTKAIEDLKPAPVGNFQASLPVNQQPVAGVTGIAGIAVVQTPRQNMEDVSDLTLDHSKPTATITVHNNESKVPKREPSTDGPKHKGNDGMNAWWM